MCNCTEMRYYKDDEPATPVFVPFHPMAHHDCNYVKQRNQIVDFAYKQAKKAARDRRNHREGENEIKRTARLYKERFDALWSARDKSA